MMRCSGHISHKAGTQVAPSESRSGTPQCGGPLNATLTYRRDIGGSLGVFRVRPDNARPLDFVPGQYATLGLPWTGQAAGTGDMAGSQASQLTRRAYSICSSPRERSYLEFFVVRIQDGQLTPQLWDLQVGDRLWIADKAKGNLTIEGIPPDRDLVMVATGTAIAPFMSILRTYHGQDRWRRLVVINGVRLVADLGYREELEGLADTDPTIQYFPIVSREPDRAKWAGLSGHVQDVLEKRKYRRLVGAPLDPARCHVFLCGNPQMIESVQQLLGQHGFSVHSQRSPGNLHLERYWECVWSLKVGNS